MANFSKHLRYLSDQSPLPGSELKSLRHTRWYVEAHADPKSLRLNDDGYTQVVFETRWLAWYRTFSPRPPSPFVYSHGKHGGNEGGLHSGNAIKRPKLIISEWIPEHNVRFPGWFSFGPNYTCAYARLHANYLDDWRSHARKHLKAFQKSQCSLRLGTAAEVADLYAVSQVPNSLQASLLAMLNRHLAVHPETIDILVAEVDGQPIACLVAGDCEEVKISEYLIGAFHPKYKHIYAMVGLVDWWYERAIAKGYQQVNFGHIHPPGWHFLDRGLGYSFFKTHFGVSRIWFPKNQWQVFING